MSEQQPAPPELGQPLTGEARLCAADFAPLWPRLAIVRVVRSGLAGLAAFALLFGIGAASSGDYSLGAAFTPLLILSGAWLVFERARGGFANIRANRLGAEPVRFTFDDWGLRLVAPRSSREVPWSRLKAFQETGEALLLRPVSGEIVVIPKRAFSAEMLGLVRALLLGRLQERVPVSLALLVAVAVVGMIALLTVWHFSSVEAPPHPPPPNPADLGANR
ncbi:MAG TPA: YcxB family protein [Polyangiaceae bacterium]|nr:YcxB family protein [Polyangiaceae bacterium]